MNNDNNTRVFVLHPNCSMSWAQTRILLAVIAALLLIIGVAWAFVGVWMILPFAGIELAALSFGLYYVSRKLQYQQVIRINDQSLLVEAGKQQADAVYELRRDKAAIAVEQARHPWDAMKITLFDREQQVEIGEFLTRSEAETLLSELQAAGLRVRSNDHTRDEPF